MLGVRAAARVLWDTGHGAHGAALATLPGWRTRLTKPSLEHHSRED